MRRRYVSDDELTKVIKLKQSGASWLKIQNITGVPRRSAQRAYQEWEHSKSTDELKKARLDVAAQEFRNHLDDLIALAQALVDFLRVSGQADEMKSADAVFDGFWRTAIRQGQDVRHGDEREEQRTVRQNKMLLRSLQDHTREKVRWEALEEWKQALDSYTEHCKSLRSEARKIVDNILEQKAGMKDKISRARGGEDVIENMAKGVVLALWRGIIAGKVYKEHVFVEISPISERNAEICFSRDARMMLRVNDAKLGEEINGVCRWAIKNLCQGNNASLVRGIANDISNMKRRASDLEEVLDDLVLRPLILRTRCDLCPA